MFSIVSMLVPNSPNSHGVSHRPACSSCDSQIPTTSTLNLTHPSAPSVVEHSRTTKQPARPRCLPWLISLAYPVARHLLLPLYFRRIEVSGREHLPATGPVIFAPTHRSRWDALIVPYAAGQDVTGRMLRFMVTADEMTGLQGWLIRRLGGFPINTRQPTIAALRHSIELLQQGETLVMFPEGDIYRQCRPLKPGLARLAVQAEASQENLGVQIVPIGIQYNKPLVPWRCTVKIRIGHPLKVADYWAETPKASARKLTAKLEEVLRSLSSPCYGEGMKNEG